MGVHNLPLIDQAIVQGFVDAGANAATTSAQGKALEDLACYVFGLVPGITITHRNVKNVFASEEIDVALFNDGLPYLPHIILIEAKNWSKRVGSEEVEWFASKLRKRGLDFGILLTTLGVTGDAESLTNAHQTVAAALLERRKIIVITTAELLASIDTDALILLIKTKLCDLAVKGTIA